MSRTVVVALDGSEAAEQALWQVGPLVDHLGLDLVLLRCVPEEPDPEHAPGDTVAIADEYLREVLSRVARPGRRVETHVRVGEPASEILGEARRLDAYLVALTTRGRSGVARWLHGSVAQRLLRRCPAPLLLCRPVAPTEGAPPAFRRVLVPLDGSERSARILPLVQDVARAYDAQVVLLRVSRRLDHASDPESITTEALARSLERERARVADAQVRVQLEGRFGDAAAEIVAYAEERGVDLVAMTTHGRRGLARWLFGSVAEHVFDSCQAPLLVQRSHDLLGPGPD